MQQLRASGCYYHPGRLAVAICPKCGVGICRECAVKAQGRILCYKCANEDIIQEHKEYRKWLKERGGNFSRGQDFIIPGIKGILLAVFGFIIYPYISANNFEVQYFPLMLYSLFSSPFLFTILDDLESHKYMKLKNLIDNWMVKVLISYVFGWIIFPFILIRFIIIKNKQKKI